MDPFKTEETDVSKPVHRIEGASEREALKMAESGEDVVFSSLQEEMEYWKEKALELRTRYGNYRAGSVVG